MTPLNYCDGDAAAPAAPEGRVAWCSIYRRIRSDIAGTIRAGQFVPGQRRVVKGYNRPESDITSKRSGVEYTKRTMGEIRRGSLKADDRANKYVYAAVTGYPGC
jgi:hypothetical protein